MYEDMELDNLRCPQFVDFTNTATFDIDDGADVYFERGVVGEFGLGFDNTDSTKDDGIDELIAALNNAATGIKSTTAKKTTNDKKDSGISEGFSISPNQMCSNKTMDPSQMNNKEMSGQVASHNKTSISLKKSTPIRKRTNSASSNRSTDSIQTKTSKIQQQHQQQAQANNKNIVKKTIAKVTAAFKTTKLGNGDSNQLKLKTKTLTITLANKKKQECVGPLKVEYAGKTEPIQPQNEAHELLELEIKENETTSSSGNRRCSSVPRTLKEKQALNKQITLGEKIQNFFSRDSHKNSKNEERGRLKNHADANENQSAAEMKKQQAAQHKSRLDDERSKINAKAVPITTKPVIIGPRTIATESNLPIKPRQRSCDRKEMPMLPYQGVKFIPKLSHKYNAAEPFSNPEERSKQIMAKKDLKKLNESDTNKQPSSANTDKGKQTGNQTMPQFTRNNKTGISNKENISAVDSDTTGGATSTNKTQNYGNDSSILSVNKTGNLSTLSNSSRKRIDMKPLNLHTEARAQKRQQYEQYLKDKERMTEMIRKNIEMQKLIESKNEIQKMRSQLTFKSKPFKQIKAMEIKPSEKPLTEPKSPHLGLFLASNGVHSKATNITRSASQDNLQPN